MLIIHCKFFKTVVTVTTTSEYNRGDDFLRLKREELWIRNYQSVEFGDISMILKIIYLKSGCFRDKNGVLYVFVFSVSIFLSL